MKKLLDSGADCYLETRQAPFADAPGFPAKTDTPLLRACFGGHSDIFKMLLDAGADIYATGLYGTIFETALAGYYDRYSFNARFNTSLKTRCKPGSERGEIIKMLRAAQLPEPSPNCHYGIQCNGPLCMNKTKHFSYLYGTTLKWIIGTRFSCEHELEIYNICEACKSALDENPNALGDHSFYKKAPKLIEFRHPEHLGQEESLARFVELASQRALEPFRQELKEVKKLKKLKKLDAEPSLLE